MRSLVASTVLLLLATGVAHADDTHRKPLRSVYAPESFQGGDETVSDIIFLNRCAQGCQVTASGDNDAVANQSTIPDGPTGQTFTVQPFAHGDAVWQQVVDCVKEVYAPFNVTIVEEDPSPMPHHEAIAAGLDSDIGLDGVGGVGVISTSCRPINNLISFSFLNGYAPSDIIGMCSTIAQESAHSFGLPDHIFDCTDPMTYLTIGDSDSCGAQFFRNKLMPCGEFQEGNPGCKCGGTRVNTHVHLISVFGESDYVSPTPTVSITYPMNGASISGTTPFQVAADARRGIYKVELYFNGWLWAEWVPPAQITPANWPPTQYVVDPPDDFPDGVIDVEVVAYDDLGSSASTTIQVTKGAPCGDAGDCAEGQQCEDGKCFWDEPQGELGDECTYDQFCRGPNVYDGRCESDGETTMCTRECFSGVNDDCPEGFACLETNADTGEGVCWFPSDDGGGCCSASDRDRGGSVAAPILLAFAVSGVLFARRRRRA